MPRAIRLPPLSREYGIPIDGSENAVANLASAHRSGRRRSVLASSNPSTDSLPIDCILVYDRTHEEDNKRSADKRSRFEDYLVRKQGLILMRVESPSKEYGYVKVHAPFEILLQTAEKMQMRLPIEKIVDDENNTSVADRSCWYRFIKRLREPFRLDPSLSKGASDYYTAIYSSHIDKFKQLFDTLHGSREAYFTPTSRSLLTHELLSRAHYDDDGHDHQAPVVIQPAIGTIIALWKGSRRSGIDQLVAEEAYYCYFPLHEPLRDDLKNMDDGELNDREKLQKYWATMRQCLKFQPFVLIRSYMGEKVAFYFALTGFYNQMLIPAALVGLIIFIYGVASVFTDESTSDICGDYGQKTYMCPRCDKICPFWKLADSCVYSQISYVFDNGGTIAFGVLMSLWARWFIELWKRRQAVLQYEWDSIDFEENLEPIRPRFEADAVLKGEKRVNPVTGIKELYVPTRKRAPFFLIAAAVVLFTMAIVCATVFGTVVYRVQMDYILKKTSVKTYSSIIITVTSAVMNLICSIILSQFYYWIARKLTDLVIFICMIELHKYQSKYDDSLTIKIYLFQFVNFYSSLFYVAFFKGRFVEYPSKYGETGSGDFTEQCDPAGCFVELSIQLIIIMIGKQIINNLFEFFAATRRSCARACCNRVKDHEHEEQWEKDNDLIDFDSETLIDEYLELVIQFGFVTLFVTAFPLAPLFALINNLIEVRLDAWKFLSKYKRPIPFKASDIGIWNDIISFVSYFAVFTNAVAIAWTSEFIPKMVYRSLRSRGTSLRGYVDWTLASFPVADYNLTGTMPSDVPNSLTYCRYRDFRESVGPAYSQTSMYWNVIAARLAFIVVFEHLVFIIIYLMQSLVPDVPQKIQNKIDHERYIDQRERWSTKTNEKTIKKSVIPPETISNMVKDTNDNMKSPTRQRNRRKKFNIQLLPDDKQ